LAATRIPNYGARDAFEMHLVVSAWEKQWLKTNAIF